MTTSPNNLTDDRDRGAYAKYYVERNGDDAGKHDDCWYFVLDIRHDKHARVALAAYAESCNQDGYRQLAQDLTERLRLGRLYDTAPDRTDGHVTP